MPAPVPGRMSLRPWRDVARHRRARRRRFQDHQAERVGEAGEDEDVGVGVMARQIVAELRPGEVRVADISPSALRAQARRRQRPSSRADRASGTLRYSSQPRRGRHKRTPASARSLNTPPSMPRFDGWNMLDIDAAAPDRRVAEALQLELLHHRRRRHHDAARLVVERVHEAIAGPERDPLESARCTYSGNWV